jgi:hypothetical protein
VKRPIVRTKFQSRVTPYVYVASRQHVDWKPPKIGRQLKLRKSSRFNRLRSARQIGHPLATPWQPSSHLSRYNESIYYAKSGKMERYHSGGLAVSSEAQRMAPTFREGDSWEGPFFDHAGAVEHRSGRGYAALRCCCIGITRGIAFWPIDALRTSSIVAASARSWRRARSSFRKSRSLADLERAR